MTDNNSYPPRRSQEGVWTDYPLDEAQRDSDGHEPYYQDDSSMGNEPTLPMSTLTNAQNESSLDLHDAPVIAVRNLRKTYTLGATKVRALRDVTLEAQRGEFVAIMGPSGSGKSTFMNLIGCLDRPSGGEYELLGTPVSAMTPDQLADVRNRKIGFVFQGFNLLNRSTALGNVMLPLIYAGVPKEEQERRAKRALQLVGLGARLHHKPNQLSGGQQQRVAIARALVNGPGLLLADEPTGNLDSRTSIEIIALLQALNERGLTIVLVTHEADIAAYAQRQIIFRDGRVVGDTRVPAPRSARQEWAAHLNTATQHPRIEIREEAR